jgi:hypothetical protein
LVVGFGFSSVPMSRLRRAKGKSYVAGVNSSGA